MRFRLRTLLIVAAICPPAIGMLGVMRKLEYVDERYYVSLLLLWMLASVVAINFTFDGISWLLRRSR